MEQPHAGAATIPGIHEVGVGLDEQTIGAEPISAGTPTLPGDRAQLARRT